MVDTASKLPSSKTTQTGVKAAPSRMWHPFESLRSEMDRLFDEFSSSRNLFAGRGGMLGRFTPGNELVVDPAFEVTAGDNAYVITVELPGLDQKNIDVSVADGMVCVRGEKKEEREDSKKDYFISERRYGSFSRSFRLPEGIDESKIAAEMKQGVLTVTLPKSAEAKQKERKVPVKG